MDKQRIDEILQALGEAFPDEAIEAQPAPMDETFIILSPDNVKTAVQILIERFDLYHLSTISGQDTDDGIELLYHFWSGGGLTLRTRLPHETPAIATLTDMIPGADFYEREIWEMLGVDFEGHPDLSLFLLPEDWDGAPPLLIQTEEDESEGRNGDQNEIREKQEDEQ
ncbi:MAG TPA: NADH-quinone oxidoreductase subunit C [Chloroflexi bacterium]|nr:NADH-quinone oxidoreductase subunit C [Chloroflexota bacterium]